VASSPSPLRPSEVAERLKAQFGDDITELDDNNFGHVVATVVPTRYRELALFVRDDPGIGCNYMDFVTAVDRKDEGFEVVTHVTNSRTALGVRIKMKLPVPGEDGESHCPTVSDIWPGANWHERETWELFGIHFDEHPHLVKLVLPEQFEGHPLRKDFELMSRIAKPWPGDQELPD
jgi:NADH-quinone oxidoreductase subunit C